MESGRKKTKYRGVYLDDGIDAQLRKEAENQRRTMSTIVRFALEEYLAKHQPTPFDEAPEDE